MVSFSGVLTAAAAGWLLFGSAAAIAHEHERFVAVETGAILSPRQYRMSPAHALLDKREGGCNPGSHPCSLPTSPFSTLPLFNDNPSLTASGRRLDRWPRRGPLLPKHPVVRIYLPSLQPINRPLKHPIPPPPPPPPTDKHNLAPNQPPPFPNLT